MSERLQKLLARAGVASRRKVEELIREGRVTVNGEVATLGDQADFAVDAVKVDGKRIHAPSGAKRYVLLHKPAGYVSTASDPQGRPTVFDLLPARLRAGGMVPVGRLDYDSEGLLVLTDDGDFAHRIAHPRHGCSKTYEVKVKGEPSAAEIDRLRQGIRLYGRRTVPADVEPVRGAKGHRATEGNTWWRVVLHEGRTRQVREMFFRIAHPVARLRRVAIGPLRDPRLPRGAWRELGDDEVEMLRAGDRKRRPAKKPVAKKTVAGGARADAGEAKAKAGERRPRRPPTGRKRGEPTKKAGPRRPGRKR